MVLLSGTMGIANQNIFVPEIWASLALGLFHEGAVMARLVNRNFEPMVQRMGDTLNIPERGVLVATAKVENSAVTLQNPQGSQHQLLLNKHYEVSFLVEDILEAQSAVKNMLGYMIDSIKVLSKEVDSSLTALYTLAGNSVTETGAITEGGILEARRYLEVGEVQDNDRSLVIHPVQDEDMLAIERFTSAERIGRSGVISEGAIGRIAGADVFTDPRIVSTTPSETAYHAMFFQRNGLILATRPLALPPAGLGARGTYKEQDGVAMRMLYAYNASYLGVQCTCDILWGCNVLRPVALVSIQSK